MSWWNNRSYVKVSASDPKAWGICDVCGYNYSLSQLRYQYQWAGPILINLHFRVCPTCYDEPSHRNNPYALPPDPVPVTDPRPGADTYTLTISGWFNDGGVLAFTSPQAAVNYPTSPIGLKPGSVWNNGLSVAVIPGVIPDPLFPAVFFGGEIDAQQLLVTGGGNLPIKNPGVTTQLWNNGGLVCVA
jgi:hypothetical protein